MNQLIKKLSGVKENQVLAEFTTFKIGGPADWFYQAKNEQDLIKAVSFCRYQKIPFFILGGGSNLLITDKGFRGMVIKLENKEEKVLGEKITVGAGFKLGELVKLASDNNLSGLEFLAGIPGTVGGAVVGNAGAWQQNIGDKVERVKVLDEKNQIQWFNRIDCQFDYRQSRFKNKKEIILAIEFVLKKENSLIIKERIKEYLSKRQSQPKAFSAGCIFINPKPKSAGDLIEKCGLKGTRKNNAEISPLHANFIVNHGGAKAKDMLELISLVKQKVKEKFGINLEEEITILGEL
jgi:UDP-N-acetylmuramate dehydrogenase